MYISYTYTHTYIYIYIYICTLKFAGPSAQGVLDLRQGPLSLFFWLTPLPPQWTLGVQITRLNQWYCLLRATLEITKTCTGAEPNRPDQITIMGKIIVEIYRKSPFSLV